MKTVLLGRAAVDSGQLMICDPCYIGSHWKHGNNGGLGGGSYQECCEATQGNNQGGPVIDSLGGKLAVAFTSGLGDGVYEVWADIQDVPDWGERITEVRIKLYPHPYFE
ncbi:MAG: hypothetical protein C4570_07840 [Ammonifex sp.]|nr:MAG: hypothetical protein C4570_07840 [Ammonifex sp.]